MSVHNTNRQRPKRKFTGERKGPLHFNISDADKQEYMYRVVNDTRTRIADMQDMDYEIVDEQPTEKTVDSANVRNRNQVGVGGGIVARLMRIPKDWWEENQAKTSQKRAMEHEQAMKASAKALGAYGSIEIEQHKPK